MSENNTGDTSGQKPRIQIIARRWFQRTYGNTYHSVRVYVNGEQVGFCPFAYGYGEQYLTTALELLQTAGVYTKTGEHYVSGASRDYDEFLTDMRNERERFTVTVADVDRKRDL